MRASKGIRLTARERRSAKQLVARDFAFYSFLPPALGPGPTGILNSRRVFCESAADVHNILTHSALLAFLPSIEVSHSGAFFALFCASSAAARASVSCFAFISRKKGEERRPRGDIYWPARFEFSQRFDSRLNRTKWKWPAARIGKFSIIVL